MKFFALPTILFSILSFTNLAGAEVSCVGSVRTVDNAGHVTLLTEPLQKNFDSPVAFNMDADIGQIHFALSGRKDSADFLLMITEGPNYTKGVTTSASWNYQGQIRASRVDGDTLYKIVCKK